MYRSILTSKISRHFLHPRHISSSRKPLKTPHNEETSHLISQQPPHHLSLPLFSLPTYPLSRTSFTLAISALAASAALLISNHIHQNQSDDDDNPLEQAIHNSQDLYQKLFHTFKQTSVAASVLWHSLTSVLSSAHYEVRFGFEIRVASFLADIAAANSERRAAIVSAGGGVVVDWLLRTVAVARDNGGAQAESARALAYLIADPNVSARVLGRPRAIPNLLRFIFSCQPHQSKKSKKYSRRSSFDISDSLKGRSLLVAAIMDIVTSSCDNAEEVSFKPQLPGNAELRDIAVALQVIEKGDLHLDKPRESEDDKNGGGGSEGIGINIIDGTIGLDLARTSMFMKLDNSDSSHTVPPTLHSLKTILSENKGDNSLAQANIVSAVVPGLWDDLLCEHVAVPFATWALANWALASEVNRCSIQELDPDGDVIVSALAAPERSVKWHASLMARSLLEDRNIPLNDSVSDWSSSLLTTIFQACQHEDISLAEVALSAFVLSVERSPSAQMTVVDKGLNLMRDITKQTTKHNQVQEAIARILELLCTKEFHLSLEESQKWSGILLSWVFGKFSSEALRSSAVKILSRILEDHGSTSAVSLGWLAMLLTEVLSSIKNRNDKGASKPKNNEVKTSINNSVISSAAQVGNQLASVAVYLAVKQMGTDFDSEDSFPLADFLSLEPFAGPFKKLKKDNLPKLDAADSASVTLKGIKALTEVCAEDSSCKDKIVDLGILCLLRRFLLGDDYEILAALEAYDASKAHEGREQISNADREPSVSDSNESSHVRVPPTAHIRRHACRLLNMLSLLPKVQKDIRKDESWCKWLDNCAKGKILGCSDLKIQSYARAALLNILCNDKLFDKSGAGSHSDTGVRTNRRLCPRYDDSILLINPHLSHWKCPREMDQEDVRLKDMSLATADDEDGAKPLNDTNYSDTRSSDEKSPPFDVVFVHGLRGGPFKTWRLAEDKSSTKSNLVEKIDQETGKLGTFWPGEWLSNDFPDARLFTIKYKTNLTEWSGATLPLQEVSSMLLEKLVAAGVGDRPVIFVTHSMGGLIVKQILFKAMEENYDHLVNNTIGIVFYSCPHFGSKLADVPWRMGILLRPAPSVGELRRGSSRLIELNDSIRKLHKKGKLDVLSFCETKVTPIVEAYGGWAFRAEIVPIESAYPGFGELVVLESTDHVNSCKPVSRIDPSYQETLKFLRKLKDSYT